MNLSQFTIQIPEYAKDLRLNLKSVLTEAGAPGLSPSHIMAVALASSYACNHPTLISVIEKESSIILNEETINSAKVANSIMAMNNIYYRFMHSLDDPIWLQRPAKLRMNGLANPTPDKQTFELMCLAISMINGCSLCMKSHTEILEKQGVSKEGIQSVARIAAVIHAAAATI